MTTARVLTQFDSLPDELDLRIKDYLNGVELFDTLYVSQTWLQQNSVKLREIIKRDTNVMISHLLEKLIPHSVTGQQKCILVEYLKLLLSLGVDITNEKRILYRLVSFRHIEAIFTLGNLGIPLYCEDDEKHQSVTHYTVNVDRLLKNGVLSLRYSSGANFFDDMGKVKIVERLLNEQVNTFATLLSSGIFIDREKFLPWFNTMLLQQAGPITEWFSNTTYYSAKDQDQVQLLLESYKKRIISKVEKHCVAQERQIKKFQQFFKSKKKEGTTEKSIELQTFANLNK